MEAPWVAEMVSVLQAEGYEYKVGGWAGGGAHRAVRGRLKWRMQHVDGSSMFPFVQLME
jgi:hypothetical protein